MSTTTRERPILFSGPMVRAILDGRKTQTRRVPRLDLIHGPSVWPGNRLWVRETWQLARPDRNAEGVVDDEVIWSKPIPKRDPRGKRFWDDWCVGYAADGGEGPWRPSIFMPRWASRITLAVTAVRPEKLQEISDADAVAEGIDRDDYITPRCEFAELWQSINGRRPGCSWADNPWVWVITFARVEAACASS